MRLIRQEWSPRAEQGLRVSAGDDLGVIRDEVLCGISNLFACIDGNQHDGYVVLRYEADCKELVLVLGEGAGFKKWLPVVEQYARQLGAETARTHVQRAGLVRWYENIGWSRREVVMAKKLEG
jgi:hypothetical protein